LREHTFATVQGVCSVCWGTDTHKQIRKAWLFETLITDLNASALIKVTARYDKCD